MARIGIYGGTFNPPHAGHMLAVRQFAEKLRLDRVLLIPDAIPPHKELPEGSPSNAERLTILKLTAEDLPCVTVSDLEMQRDGRSYTVETLRELRQQYRNDSLYLLMGTDMFLSFDSWYLPEEICREATLAVAYRGQCRPEEQKALEQKKTLLETQLHASVIFINNACLPLSSSTVRRMLAFGCGKNYFREDVYDYIVTRGLYLTTKNLKGLSFEQLRKESLALHKTSRKAHVDGCSCMAERLALRWGENPEDARRAGILHDITKALDGEEQLRLCSEYGIILNNFDRAHPKLLHAKTGAYVAGRIFGESEKICDGIYWHTTGKADMTLFEKIIYLADYIEDNRSFEGVEALRSHAFENLDQALLEGFQMSLDLLKRRQCDIDRNSLEARNYLWEEYHKNPAKPDHETDNEVT